MRYMKASFVMSVVILVVILFSQCFEDNSQKTNDPRGEQYAGMPACIGCHKEIAASFPHTNHYKTSSAANGNMLKKITDTSKKYFYYDSSHIRFEETNNGFFQALFVKDTKETSRRFDISFGSAEKAQTYGSWDDDQLFQLPLTYYSSMNTWANSPGFPTNHPKFDRLIINGCFQCHATYIAKEDVPSGPVSVRDKFYPATLIYGIDCERCHGPAAAHVKFQQENPLVKTAKYITSIKSLSRQQQLDICATCHSGNDRSAQRSIFSFVPGDTLANFYFPEFGFGSMNNPQADVHGRQMQLLQSSKCFQKTNMTCGTCHNPHEPQRNNSSIFISKCMNCHQQSAHALGFMKKIEQTKNNTELEKISCITCHMPLQTSKLISFKDGATAKSLPYYLRTHRIAVY